MNTYYIDPRGFIETQEDWEHQMKHLLNYTDNTKQPDNFWELTMQVLGLEQWRPEV